MKREEIEVKVIEIIVYILGVNENEVTPQINLQDLGADSLDAIEVLMELEKEFSITITDSEWESCTTLSLIVDKVEEKLK